MCIWESKAITEALESQREKSNERIDHDPQWLGAPGRRAPAFPARRPVLSAGSPGPTVGSHGLSIRGAGARCSAAAAGLAVTRAPAARAAHAERLIRQRSDVTPIGRARSAPRSHCSGDSRSAHSGSQRGDCGPRPAPAGPGARSSGKPGRAALLQQGASLSERQVVGRWLFKLAASWTADRFGKARPMNSR